MFLDVDDWQKSGDLKGPVDVARADAVHGRVDDSALEVAVHLNIVQKAEK